MACRALLLVVVVTVGMLAVTVDARPEDNMMMMMKKGSAMGSHKMMHKQPHQAKTQQHMQQQHMFPQMMGALTAFISPQAYAYPRPYMAYAGYSPAAYPTYSYAGGYPMYAYGMGGGYRMQQMNYSPYYGRWWTKKLIIRCRVGKLDIINRTYVWVNRRLLIPPKFTQKTIAPLKTYSLKNINPQLIELRHSIVAYR